MFEQIKMPLKPSEKLAFITVIWILLLFSIFVISKVYENVLVLSKTICSLDEIQSGSRVIFNGKLERVDDVMRYNSIKKMNIDIENE